MTKDLTRFKITDPEEMKVRAATMTGHPGAFIRNVLIPEYGLDVAKTARAIGVARPGFIKTLDGEYAVTLDLAYKLGALMRDEVADLLIAWQHKHDLDQERDKRAEYRRTIQRVTPPAE
jgi:plasmid maintenance system antidote protein VapI